MEMMFFFYINNKNQGRRKEQGKKNIPARAQLKKEPPNPGFKKIFCFLFSFPLSPFFYLDFFFCFIGDCEGVLKKLIT